MFHKNKNLISGIFIFAFSLFFFILSFSINLTNIDKLVGSRLFPQIITILMMMFSLWLIIDNLIKNKKNIKIEQVNDDGEVEKNDGPKPNYKNTILVFLSLAIYIFLLNIVGFSIATIFYLFTQMCLLETKTKRNFGKYAIISVLATFAIYFIFTKGFSLILPRGIIF